MKHIQGDSLCRLYLDGADLVVRNGRRKSDMNELEDVVLSYRYSESDFEKYCDIISAISDHELFRHGREKAGRAYGKFKGNITKPSYRGRMDAFPFLKAGSNSFEPINQFEIIGKQFAEAPQSSNLALSVFHPSDIADAFRPGYVPCLSFIDLKFRAGKLNTKFFFRSCDFAEVAVFDLYYCVKLSEYIASDFRLRRPDLNVDVHNVIWYFSRAFTYKRRREPFFEFQRLFS